MAGLGVATTNRVGVRATPRVDEKRRGQNVTDDVGKKLVVALDVKTYEAAEKLVGELSPLAGWFKVGSVMFTREGPRLCRLVKDSGAGLFLDLKFHDIPNTVVGAVTSAAALGADMLTVHISGGQAMLEAAVRAREEAGRNDMIIVGVTVLTHLTFEDFHSLFVSERSTNETVLAFTKLAQRCGLNGVVASARELPLIRRHVGPDFTVVTPGIRMADAASDDQVRIVTPRRAIEDGASYIVVGRPIIAAPDPAGACQRILENMAS
ncbi:MAG: orotidine-5'-phosphate decarboxylase [Candidatus Latescibacterota bacterium]|nr:MAG: orotidine-5'-phosphate decarboxylase [Candidatus Latescibacterota bacterium]